VETRMHGSAAATGGAIPSSTVTGRPTAQALWVIPGVFCCGPQLSCHVRPQRANFPIASMGVKGPASRRAR
jgi:hypothetical protein